MPQVSANVRSEEGGAIVPIGVLMVRWLWSTVTKCEFNHYLFICSLLCSQEVGEAQKHLEAIRKDLEDLRVSDFSFL